MNKSTGVFYESWSWETKRIGGEKGRKMKGMRSKVICC